jgi:hypothetical protein
MYFKEMGWEVVDWFNLTQDTDEQQALVNTVISFSVL